MFNPTKHMITIILALGLVLAVIYGLAFLAKKLKTTKFVNRDMQIEAIMHINTKVKLMIVNIGESRMLLGVTSDSVNKLSDLALSKNSVTNDGYQ